MNRGKVDLDPRWHWGVLFHPSKVWGGCSYSHFKDEGMELRKLNELLMFSKIPKWKPQDVRLSPQKPSPWLSTLLCLISSKLVRQLWTSGRGEGHLLGGSGQRKMLLLPTSGSQGAPWSRLDGDQGAHATLPPGVLATTCLLGYFAAFRLHVGNEASSVQSLVPVWLLKAGGLAHF